MPDNPKLVFNIEPASPSMVRAMDVHERLRAPDGTSAIDPLRRHLNELLVGLEAGPFRSLDAFYAQGVKRPTAQAEAPYLRIVISASPSFFRPDRPDAAGTWDEARMKAWRDRTLAWLKAEFGDDLVYASLHLDEDTPHVHALVAPTYERKARKPGRMKRSETPEEFAARVAEAQAADGVRTVGRASHPTLKLKGSFTLLRKSLALAVADLGIEYGEDRTPDAPPGLSTREWVRQETVRLRRERQSVEQEKEALAVVTEQLEDGIALAVSLVADGSVRRTPGGVYVPPEHKDALRPVWPLIGPAMGQMMTLRARWVRGIARLRDLFTRNEVAAELRQEARQMIEEAHQP